MIFNTAVEDHWPDYCNHWPRGGVLIAIVDGGGGGGGVLIAIVDGGVLIAIVDGGGETHAIVTHRGPMTGGDYVTRSAVRNALVPVM